MKTLYPIIGIIVSIITLTVTSVYMLSKYDAMKLRDELNIVYAANGRAVIEKVSLSSIRFCGDNGEYIAIQYTYTRNDTSGPSNFCYNWHLFPFRDYVLSNE